MRIRVWFLGLLLAGIAVEGTVRADTNFVVTNSGITAWLIAGVAGNSPTLTLTKGQTYNFQVNVTGHPFFISTAANSTTGPHFATGVTNENAQGSTLTFVVPASAPATLFYQCGAHSGMSGQLNIVAAPAVPAAGQVALLGLAALVLMSGLVIVRRRARS